MSEPTNVTTALAFTSEGSWMDPTENKVAYSSSISSLEKMETSSSFSVAKYLDNQDIEVIIIYLDYFQKYPHHTLSKISDEHI
jgi:hypothetical protein